MYILGFPMLNTTREEKGGSNGWFLSQVELRFWLKVNAVCGAGGFLILYIWFSNRSYYLPNPSVCILLSVSTQYYYLLINIATNHRLAHSFRSIPRFQGTSV